MSHYRRLMWNEKITVYHLTEITDEHQRPKTTYVRSVYEDCFFNRVQTISVSGNSFVASERYVVRIPAECDAIVSPEDLIVKGEVLDETVNGTRLSDIKDKYAGMCFTVEGVSDDTKLTETAHLKVTGK